MVKVRDEHPKTAEGALDKEAWLLNHFTFKEEAAKLLVNKALALAEAESAECASALHEPGFEQALKMAEILAALKLDAATVAAAIVFPGLAHGQLTAEQVSQQLSKEVAKLATGAIKMNALSAAASEYNKQQNLSHLDKLRKMLLAMAEDSRVVLIKLAEHLCQLRAVKDCSETERLQVARLSEDIFAPLANRLGVGQIKWELEDLAFRYFQPATYKRIAKLLDERRVDRERYIKRVIITLQETLAAETISADVQGRVKHIYSIWRKMHRKGLSYEEIYDIRAVRILVPNIQSCYSALGVVHTLWQHIPKEFDDYIATPKENGYQSLHTAVVGPEGKNLEVQIRTQQMHQESELGVAAHWRYKEGVQRDESYESKIIWLRQLLDWQEEISDANALMDELKIKVIEERVYVLTPKGDVIDLPAGATPLDFAYTVHTAVGHRCRGAKINGSIVPLTYCLQTGEKVEIITAKAENPSRDWLNTNLGYIKSARARAKIQQWFKHQDKDKNIAEGRTIYDREMQRLGLEPIDLGKVAPKLNMREAEDVLAALATGDVRFGQVLNLAGVTISSKSNNNEVIPFELSSKDKRHVQTDQITIQGIGNLLTQLARCCRPLPGDDIIGYITQGRGVTIHRKDCSNIIAVEEKRGERLIAVQWGGSEKTYPVDIRLLAFDRPNLLRDLTAVLANEHVNLLSLNSATERSSSNVLVTLCIEITDLSALSKIIDRLSQLHNVINVKRQS